ncbi:transposase IS4 family protein [Caballeronia arationis]|nr:transposase IS4 family protein [Caballeronia arationis]
MKARGTGVVGYNVQTEVDTKHHLIVTHVVTNDGIDRDQLMSMAKLDRTEMVLDKLTAVADQARRREGTKIAAVITPCLYRRNK